MASTVVEVRIPGSKSVTARALFLSAAAAGTSELLHPLRSDDTEAFAAGLTSLGYAVEAGESSWTVTGSATGPSGQASVYCRDAGTAARFLPTLAGCGSGSFRFDASEQLRRRPIQPVTSALRRLGASVEFEHAENHLPFTVETRGLSGGSIEVDAEVSSQFLTGLLMAAPLMRDGLAIAVPRLVSAPYIEMTVRMMASFGVSVQTDGRTFTVPAQPYTAQRYEIEPDASTSSYFFAAAALTGNSITVPGLGSASLQGDVEFARILQRMGAEVDFGERHITVTGTGNLHGIDVNMRDVSDTMPTLAAIAPFADGPVRIHDVANTRVKESDRLEACAVNLRRLGITVSTGPDWIEILPGKPEPALMECFRDHRIAMSFSITGLRTPGITLDDPDCVRKTFPEFHQVLSQVRQAWARPA